MSNKFIFSSVIIGLCMVFSAGIISGAIDLKDEHVVHTTQGEVKLGDVYKENRLLSISIKDDAGRNILNIEDVNPSEAAEKITAELDSIISEHNATVTDNHQIDKASMSLKDNATVKVESAMSYNSSLQSNYKLVLDSENFTLSKNEVIYDKLISIVADFVSKQKPAYDSASYIK